MTHLVSWLLFPATLVAVFGGAIVALERGASAGAVLGLGGLGTLAVVMLFERLRPFRPEWNRARGDLPEIAELYCAHADAMHDLWSEGPTTVIHGDPHLGNLFDDAGRVGFLDWGIVSTGPPLRDVSYFLCMALDVEARRKHERELLAEYLSRRAAAGATALSFDEAWRAHRLHAAYTVVASCQIATFPEGISEARRVFSEAFLARARAAVEDLESAAALAAESVGR